MLSIEELAKQLSYYSVVEIHKETGVSRPTIIAIRKSKHLPQMRTYMTLCDFVSQRGLLKRDDKV